MLKKLIEFYVRKTKNKEFYFDKNISLFLVFIFAYGKGVALLRGFFRIGLLKNGGKIFLGRSVKIFNKKNIDMGNNINIGDYVKLFALGHDPIILGNNVNIGHFTQLVISTTFNNIGKGIKIGNNVGLGEFSYLGGAGGLEIGDDTIIGQYFSAHPENHNFKDFSILIREQGVNRQGIKIGSNCWIGAKVTVLDGVEIGNNSVIAAGSVVTKSYGDNLIIAGIPAKKIGIR
jgi:acetyltransferase-like isoleucine patch superfamily enzyme